MHAQPTASSSQRVVITGMGWITPLGHDIETVWRRLLAGESGVKPTQRFNASTFPTTFSAQVTDYDHRRYVADPALHEYVLPNTAFALGAAAQAWRMAGLDKADTLDRERLGIYLGSGEGIPDFDSYAQMNVGSWDADANRNDYSKWLALAADRMSVMREVEQEANMPLTHLAMEFEARGPAYNCLTACAASTQAIGEASQILLRDDADVMIAGGAHTMIHPLGVTGFNRLTALSTRNDAIQTASRPFSSDREGFVLGEGAGIVILETLEHARRRNAHILAEIIGYGSSADAYRITDMHPTGRGPAAAMHQAMQRASVTPDQIDYISVHGTSTKENDSIETRAIKAVFEGNTSNLCMSSIKSMMGHLIAAAGVVELITCVLAIRDGKVPPTINLNNPDPECDLDYIPNQARTKPIHICLSNNYGFGGQNDTLILRQFHNETTTRA